LNKEDGICCSKFDKYKGEILSLLRKSFSLPQILKVIRIGTYTGLKRYILTRNLKKELNFNALGMMKEKKNFSYEYTKNLMSCLKKV